MSGPVFSPSGEKEAVVGAEVFVVPGPVVRSEVQVLCDRLTGMVRGSGARDVVVDLGEVRGTDPATVEAVARLRLTAARLGCRVRFVRVSPGLQVLLGWLGLGEAVGQAEQGEEPGRVQERVEPGDPAL
ncbi:STAS domain-containing protein [Streptomyces marincola]|uniref:STAS domain-containing protein n=1 Tax=Streptomyces marincola TaxID=2878388 RepID=A0A1W7CXA0_9ACTN|nr:STAS domain-containing protein [Streptomyces marincola]ARQ69299.1 hypothetical protein CAG99_10840 [Streptomyces marincola]